MNLRHIWYRFRFRHGRHLPLRVPVDVSLELASHCNMRCSYCYHGDPSHLPFQRGLMPFRLAKKILYQAANLGVPSLKFNWKGESTLHPEFHDITQLARRLHQYEDGKVFIDRLTNSNFKFPTENEKIFLGLCNQTKVKVSFDSFRADVFEKQREGGVWALTYANLRRFHDYPLRTHRGVKLVIQAVRTKLNADEDIEYYAKRDFPDATISIREMVAGRVEKDVSALENRKRDPSERQSCQQAHVRVIFNHEGRAFPCCPDIGEKLCIGDIRQNSLAQIFNSPQAKHLRKSLKDKSAFASDPCLNCSSFETFRGYKPNWES
jgi:radical SAM protein with 4Fe4S-binding SPASM domain